MSRSRSLNWLDTSFDSAVTMRTTSASSSAVCAPAKKLYEELLADADLTQPSAHPRLRIARLNDDASETWTSELLEWLGSRNGDGSPASQRERLARFIPEYKPKKVIDRRAVSVAPPATSVP